MGQANFERDIAEQINFTAPDASTLIENNVISGVLGEENMNAIQKTAQTNLFTPSEQYKYFSNNVNEWQKIKEKINIKNNKIIENFDGNNELGILIEAINLRHDNLKNKEIDPNFNTNAIQNAKNTITPFIEAEKTDYEKLYNYGTSFLEAYKLLDTYNSSASLIFKEKQREKRKLQNKIDTYDQNMHMDQRKDDYQEQNFSFYKSMHFFILILYYSLFVLYLIFSDFLKEENYKNKFALGGLFAYLVFPFLIKHILVYLYKTYIYILEYNNLREDVISYPYIVDPENKYDEQLKVQNHTYN